ncbi:hypothetical protein BC829DRAFT_40860 [Chytridium lagenaria]|nr:hypothetical protein BC829DRAFT_40860 [Chytridium lagenaria]
MKQIKTKKSAFDPTLVTVRERRNSFYSNRLVAVGDEVLALLPASRKGVVVVNGCEGEVQDDDSGDSRNCIRIADEASKHNERITALQVRNLGLGSKEKMEFSTAIRIVVPGHEHVFLRAAISRPIISVDFGYVMNISPIIPSQSRPILNLHIIEATPLALNNDKFYERGVDFESSRFIEVNNEDFVEDGPFNVVGSMIFPSTCEDDEGSLEALMKQKMTKKSKFDPTLVTEREQRKSFYSNRCAAVSDEILSLLPVSTKE